MVVVVIVIVTAMVIVMGPDGLRTHAEKVGQLSHGRAEVARSYGLDQLDDVAAVAAHEVVPQAAPWIE
jgi:hypothetical protein